MASRSAYLVMMFTALATGCATMPIQEATPLSRSVASSELKITLTERCAISGPPREVGVAGEVLVPVLVSLVNVLIDATGNALVAAGQPKTVTYPLTYSYEFYQITGGQWTLNKEARCLTIYKNRNPQAVDVSDNRDFYFEGFLTLSPDSTAFRLEPQHFTYNNNLWDSIVSSKRDIVLSFDFQKPSADSTKAFGTSALIFRDIRPGDTFDASKLSKIKMAYMPLPTLDGPGQTKIQEAQQARAHASQLATEKKELTRTPTSNEARLAAQRRQFNRLTSKEKESDELIKLREEIARLERHVRIEAIDRTLNPSAVGDEATSASNNVARREGSALNTTSITGERATPVNLNVVVAETRDGSELLLAAGRVLQGASGSLKNVSQTAINNALLPSAIEANKLAERTASNTAQLAILQAELEVTQKLKELADLPPTAIPETRAVVEQNLRIAKLQANIAYQTAGLPEPYPDARPK